MSLREFEASHSSPRTAGRQSSRTRHARSLDHTDHGERTDDERRRRRREEERRARRHAEQREAHTSRRVEHQSSLRSLLSTSDGENLEEEILRQIVEEGWLDGIDLNTLDPQQEEELSERIAEAYRRRHRHRFLRRHNETVEPSREHGHRRTRSETVSRRGAASRSRESSRHPPVSRPHLLEQTLSPPSSPGHRRRASDQGTAARRRTSPAPVSQGSTSEVVLRPAARSSTDITSQRPPSSHAGRSRLRGSSVSASRRPTEPEGRISETWIAGGRERDTQHQRTRSQTVSAGTSSSSSVRQGALQNSTPTRSENAASVAGGRERDSQHQMTSRPIVSSPTSSPSIRQGAFQSFTPTRSDHAASGLTPPSCVPPENGDSNAHSRPSSSRSDVPRESPTLYPEPSISCDRCNRPDIQYDLYKNCPRCNVNLCLRCYRTGRGCLHWFGFGPSALLNFQRKISALPSLPREPPHVLRSCRYRKPAETARRTVDDEGKQTTSDNPASRLQEGVFCDICHTLANDCFWKCSQCNDGEWGFCNRCVNQGRCCTHPLLPVRRVSPSRRNSRPPTAADTSNTSTTPTSLTPPPIPLEHDAYNVLSFTTKCDVCTHPITPSTTRFHCPQCNDGDYDICPNCYLKLVAAGKISKENGHNGWRRCLKGHRMIVVGFEDHEDGQRRVVVRDLVGGHALKDEHVLRGSHRSDSPGSGTGSGPASPELGSGYWSWKEAHGQEGRKKASRVRNYYNYYKSDPSSPSSPTTTPTARRFPPDGGVGLVVQALWSYYPDDDVTDELLFPRGAEITEAENVNDDWFWGCYAGATGLFPGGHGRVVREVM